MNWSMFQRNREGYVGVAEKDAIGRAMKSVYLKRMTKFIVECDRG